MEKIIKNRAYCKLCGKEVESKSVHDLRSCKCGALSVDGGRDYCRRVGHPANYIDTSVVIETTDIPKFRVGQTVQTTDGARMKVQRIDNVYGIDHYHFAEEPVVYYTEDSLKAV